MKLEEKKKMEENLNSNNDRNVLDENKNDRSSKIDFTHNIILDKEFGHEFCSAFLISNIYVVKSSQKILHLIKEGQVFVILV